MARSPLELGAYALPGRVADPRPGLVQAQAGEALGLGSIWVAERWEKKEIAATLGALTQKTERVKLVAGMTHFGTRHPIVLAGMASTLQALPATASYSASAARWPSSGRTSASPCR